MLRKLSIDDLYNYRVKDEKEPFLYFSTIVRLGKWIPEEHTIDLSRPYEYCDRVSPNCGVLLRKLVEKSNDSIFLNIVKSHILYREGGYTNYYPSQPLLGVLDKIKVDMPCDQVPREYKAYFELNGFLGMGYAIIDVENTTKGTENIRIVFSENHRESDCSYLGVTLDNEKNLIDIIKSNPFSMPKLIDGKVCIDEVQLPDIMEQRANLLINLIIYTCNPNEEFKKQFNQFSPNKKVAQKEKLTYTEKPFVEIGFNAEFLRLTTVESGLVRAHARWQPCGIGRLQRKLIIIDSHERKYKKIN